MNLRSSRWTARRRDRSNQRILQHGRIDHPTRDELDGLGLRPSLESAHARRFSLSPALVSPALEILLARRSRVALHTVRESSEFGTMPESGVMVYKNV